MALQKTTISIPFGEGLDTKTDQKMVEPNKLTKLENAVFTKGKSLNKRNGYNKLNTFTIDGKEITSAKALEGLGKELLLFDGASGYTYSSSSETWNNQGPASEVDTNVTSIVRNSDSEQSNVDVTYLSGLNIYTWNDSRGGVRATVTNAADNSVVINDTELHPTAAGIKCITVGSTAIIVYIAGNNLYGRTVGITSPVFGTQTLLFNDVNGSIQHFDIIGGISSAAITYYTTTPDIKVAYLRSDLSIGGPLNGLPNPVTVVDTVDNTIGIHNNQGILWVAYHNNTTGTRAFALNADLTSKLSPTTLEAVTTPITKKVTFRNLSDTQVSVYFTVNNTTVSFTSIKNVNITDAGAVTGLTTLAKSVGLAAKGFTIGDNFYLPCAHESDEQSTYFLLNEFGIIYSKMIYRFGGGLPGGLMLGNSAEVDEGSYIFAVQEAGRLLSEGGDLFTLSGLSRVTMTIDNPETSSFNSVELGDKLHIAGGIPKIYDGSVIVEDGFLLYPEGISNIPSSTGGSMSDGTYLITALYEWSDNRGDIHRSVTSTPISVTLVGGTSTQSIVLTIPTLHMTQKQNVSIVVYTTTNNGTLFYRESLVTSPLLNDESVDTVNFTVTLSDADKASNELLYTTGGVLNNDPPPSSDIITTYNTRIFLAGLADRNLVQYSKAYETRTAVGYSSEFRIQLEGFGGPITALKTLDDKLVIFKETAIYVVRGKGPNNAGLDNDLTEPQLVATDTGALNAKSVVITPLGIMYKSRKGIYLLDRGLNTVYIGAPVEEFNELNISRAVLVPDVNEVRFLTDNNTLLVFNYYFSQWSVFTGIDNGTDAILVDGVFYYSESNGEVAQEVIGRFLDKDGQPISQSIETGWYAFNKRQGYQRVYSFSLLGEYKSEHVLRVRVAYNYRNYWAETFFIKPGEILNTSTWGSQDTWGSGDVWGGVEDTVYQFKIRPKVQKCQSIKIEIVDLFESGGTQGYEISDIMFELGAKKGTFRMPSNKEIGG